MSGIGDFEPKLKSLDRIGPETTKAFEMLDSGASLSPQQCADLLEGLGQEADRLEAELNEAERTADDCGQIGRNETLLTLQAARLRLMQATNEVAARGLSACDLVGDQGRAIGLLMDQAAAFWSTRTRIGGHRLAISPLPASRSARGSKPKFEGRTDIVAAIRVAPDMRELLLKEASVKRDDVKKIVRMLDGDLSDHEEESIARKVRVLKAEQDKRLRFMSFLIRKGWVTPSRRRKSMASDRSTR